MTTWKSAESAWTAPRNNGQPKRIVLEQSGWDDDGNPHEIDTPNKHLIRVTALENDPRRRVTRFSVEAVLAARGSHLARFQKGQKNGKPKGFESIHSRDREEEPAHLATRVTRDSDAEHFRVE